MNQQEYIWVKKTREILLDFCRDITPSDFTKQLEGYGFPSVQDTLLHVADCYIAWLGSFVLEKTTTPITPKEKRAQLGFEEIKARFAQVDLVVNEIFEQQLDELIQKEIPWRTTGEILSITPRKLLFHTITHEFHHKGQIVKMIRQLGYVPPNTDVLGTLD